MQDYPSNSRQAKGPAPEAPREKLKPVTSAKKTERKRGLGRQFRDTFIGGSGRDALGYMVEEIVVPSVRDMFADALRGGIDRLFYGDRGGKPRRTSSILGHGGGHTDYSRISMGKPKPTESAPRMLSRRARARHSLEELVIPTRAEAEEVLDQLYEVLSKEGMVTISILYELTGIRPEHVDQKWGWTSLRGARAVRMRSGEYLLDLPEPEALG